MTQILEFSSNNAKPFIDWLKRFVSIEKSLLLEIDGESKYFKAKSYDEGKSVVKFSKISFQNSSFTLSGKKSLPNMIKIGIYSIQRFMKILENFSGSEFSMSVSYEESSSGDLVALAIIIKNSALKMKLECTPITIFTYISDKLFHDNIAKSEISNSFLAPQSTIEKINSLCELDKEYKFLEFISKDNRISVLGKTFKYNLEEAKSSPESVLSIYKDQFDKLDKESYNVNLGNDRIIFNSNDSETISVLSMVVKDTKYEEMSSDF